MSTVTIKRKYFEIEIAVEEDVNEQGNLPIEIEVRCIKEVEPLQVGDFCNAGSMEFFLAQGVFLDDAGKPCIKNLYTILGTLAMCAEEWMIKAFLEDAKEASLFESGWHNNFPKEAC